MLVAGLGLLSWQSVICIHPFQGRPDSLACTAVTERRERTKKKRYTREPCFPASSWTGPPYSVPTWAASCRPWLHRSTGAVRASGDPAGWMCIPRVSRLAADHLLDWTGGRGWFLGFRGPRANQKSSATRREQVEKTVNGRKAGGLHPRALEAENERLQKPSLSAFARCSLTLPCRMESKGGYLVPVCLCLVPVLSLRAQVYARLLLLCLLVHIHPRSEV